MEDEFDDTVATGLLARERHGAVDTRGGQLMAEEIIRAVVTEADMPLDDGVVMDTEVELPNGVKSELGGEGIVVGSGGIKETTVPLHFLALRKADGGVGDEMEGVLLNEVEVVDDTIAADLGADGIVVLASVGELQLPPLIDGVLGKASGLVQGSENTAVDIIDSDTIAAVDGLLLIAVERAGDEYTVDTVFLIRTDGDLFLDEVRGVEADMEFVHTVEAEIGMTAIEIDACSFDEFVVPGPRELAGALDGVLAVVERLRLHEVEMVDTIAAVDVGTTIPVDAFGIEDTLLSALVPSVGGTGFEIGGIAMIIGRSPPDSPADDAVASHPRDGVVIIAGFGHYSSATEAELELLRGAVLHFVDGRVLGRGDRQTQVDKAVAAVPGLEVEIICSGLGDPSIVIEDREVRLADGGVDGLLGGVDIVDEESMGTIPQVEVEAGGQKVEIPSRLGIDLTIHSDRTAVAQGDAVEFRTAVGDDDTHAEDTVATAGVEGPGGAVGILQVLRHGVGHGVDDGGIDIELVPLMEDAFAIRPAEGSFLGEGVITPDDDGILEISRVDGHFDLVDTIAAGSCTVGIAVDTGFMQFLIMSDPLDILIGADGDMLGEMIGLGEVIGRLDDGVSAHTVAEGIADDGVGGDDHVIMLDLFSFAPVDGDIGLGHGQEAQLVDAIAAVDVGEGIVIESALGIGVSSPLDRVSFKMLHDLLEELGRAGDIMGLDDAVTAADAGEGIHDGGGHIDGCSVEHHSYVGAEILREDGMLRLGEEGEVKVADTIATIGALEVHRIIATGVIALAVPIVIFLLDVRTYLDGIPYFSGVVDDEGHLVDTIPATGGSEGVEVVSGDAQFSISPVEIGRSFADMGGIVHVEIIGVGDIEADERVACPTADGVEIESGGIIVLTTVGEGVAFGYLGMDGTDRHGEELKGEDLEGIDIFLGLPRRDGNGLTFMHNGIAVDTILGIRVVVPIVRQFTATNTDRLDRFLDDIFVRTEHLSDAEPT